MAGHRWAGYLAWVVLFGALFAWEGLGLARPATGLPTLSDTLRAVMRYPVGRWVLFAFWLWFGWHAFVRGWHFLLRGPEGGGQPAGRSSPPGISPALLRQDVLPLLIGYLLLMATLGLGLRLLHRHLTGPPHTTARRGWLGLARHTVGTAVGGYLLLMAVVFLYYYGVARQSAHFLTSAVTGAAILVALAVPVFLALSRLRERRRPPGRP
ncbi:DUF6256 family protein [Peterkaempfera bronchialis]|uniref:Uncharacterized protein n=1 Tax=Peterkaempfera bronchialis TaxID=2126346 RepID=A0A345T3M5_9ACTN|nr:DUF6256 family protein [Peterkaempfera bronchialis]AXI80580.1 hypothetical protein C7M71_027510 [Peterkaempfera bronchialis]